MKHSGEAKKAAAKAKRGRPGTTTQLPSRAQLVCGSAVSFVLAARSIRKGSCHIGAIVSRRWLLGTAKVMGYKDLQDARAKRADTEAAKATRAKGNQGRKRTKAEADADATEPKRKVARAGEGLAPTRASVPSPRVPVARRCRTNSTTQRVVLSPRFSKRYCSIKTFGAVQLSILLFLRQPLQYAAR